MGGQAPRPLVLDTGALIAFERGQREVNVLIQRAKDAQLPILSPAGVVAQAWRDGSRQARLATLLASRHFQVEDLTAIRARAIGVLCGRSSTADVVDASVVLAARRSGAVVATSDPDDLLRIDPSLSIVRV